jgi:hypothetical protein
MLTGDLAERVAEGGMLTEEDFADLEPYFVKEGIKENSFVYPEDTDNPLVPGFYCWQINAFDVAGNLIGVSVAGLFGYKLNLAGILGWDPGDVWDDLCKEQKSKWNTLVNCGWKLANNTSGSQTFTKLAGRHDNVDLNVKNKDWLGRFAKGGDVQWVDDQWGGFR